MTKKTNWKTHVLLLMCAVLFLSVPRDLSAAEAQVSIRLSDNLGHIGDVFSLKIRVKSPVDLDDIKFKIEKSDFEIIGEQKTVHSAQTGFNLYEKNVSLAFYKTGEFEVGPFIVELVKGGSVIESHKTNSVPVSIKTILKEEDKDIKPLKGLMEIKGDPFYVLQYVLLALGIIGVIVGAILWLRRRRRLAAAAPPPPMTPLEEFISRLKELDALRFLDKGKHKLHYIEMTQIIKHFLFRQYGFNAEDFTTYETAIELERYEREDNVRDNIRFILDTADLVKFAKFVPDIPVIQEVNDKLKDLMAVYQSRLPQPGTSTGNDGAELSGQTTSTQASVAASPVETPEPDEHAKYKPSPLKRPGQETIPHGTVQQEKNQ